MKTKSILSFILAFIMVFTLYTPVFATNTQGVTFSAKLDKNNIEVSTEDQIVTVTVDANKQITWDGIGFKAFYDSPLKLTNITNKEITLTAADIQVEKESGVNGAGFDTESGENEKITNICVLHFTIPANTPAGTYDLGIQQLEITSDYGDIWENNASAMTTLTIKEKGSTEAVTYAAVPSTPTFNVSDSDQTLTVTVDASKEITWDGIGFKAFYDSPLKLTNITNKEITLTAADIQVEKESGVNGAGFDTESGENEKITNICVLHFTIPANTPAGIYNLGIKQLEITSDYGDIWEANAVAMTTIEIKDVSTHTCEGSLVAGQDADCTLDGWEDYYKCSCGKYFEDSSATVEIPDIDAWKAEAGKIPAGHDYGTDWESDEDNHWNQCSCGDKTNINAHSDNNNDGLCDFCSYNVGIPPINPPTGDDSKVTLWVSLLVISVLGIAATNILDKKRISVK